MNLFAQSIGGLGQRKANWRYALHRAERRAAYRLIGWLIKRYYWHNTILDTDIPNVGCLKAMKIVTVNQYGQTREWPRVVVRGKP